MRGPDHKRAAAAADADADVGRKVSAFLDYSDRPETMRKRCAWMRGFWLAGFFCTTFLRRATAILLQQKNFGPNVVYYFIMSYVIFAAAALL